MEMCPGWGGGGWALTERRLFWMHVLVSAVVPRSRRLGQVCLTLQGVLPANPGAAETARGSHKYAGILNLELK